jgi:hypothetical protein
VRPWSVWKLSFAFSVCMVGVVTTAGAIVWAVAATLGVVGNIERFIENLGFDAFTFDGGAMLRALVIGGLIASLAASVTAAVLTVMFNLLSDLTGVSKRLSFRPDPGEREDDGRTGRFLPRPTSRATMPR